MHRRGHLVVAPTEKNVRRRPTLPQPLGCSTIGAERLNFRVRDGTGCFPFAMAAVTLADPRCLVWSQVGCSKLVIVLSLQAWCLLRGVCVCVVDASVCFAVVRGVFVVLVEGLCDKPSAY